MLAPASRTLHSLAPKPSLRVPGLARVQYNFDRTELANAEWLRHGDREYYSFAPARGWRVVVLDPYQIALIGHTPADPRRAQAVELIGRTCLLYTSPSPRD